MWDTEIEYDAGGLLSLRFFDHFPKIETLRFGRETAPLINQSPAIVIAAFGFGVRKGDIVTLRIDGPRSTVFEHSITMDKQSGTIHAIRWEKAFASDLAFWGISRNSNDDT